MELLEPNQVQRTRDRRRQFDVVDAQGSVHALRRSRLSGGVPVGGTHVIYVLHDTKHPELYGGLPRDPHIPLAVRFWKSPLKWLGNLAILGGIFGMALHYMRVGTKKEVPIPPGGQESAAKQEKHV